MIVHVCPICVAWSSEKLNMVAIGVEIVVILIWGWLSSWLDMEMLWDVLIVDFFYKKKSTWPACTWPLSSPLLASNSYVHSLLQGHHLVANTKAHLDLLISLINLATLIFICPHDNDLHTKFLWRETKKLVIIFIILLCFRAFLNVFIFSWPWHETREVNCPLFMDAPKLWRWWCVQMSNCWSKLLVSSACKCRWHPS